MIRSLRTFSKLSLLFSRKLVIKSVPLPFYSPKLYHHHTFSTTKPLDYVEEEWKLLEELHTHKCEGCGVHVQCEHSDQQGYIPKEKAIKVLLHNKRVEENPINLTGDRLSLRAQRQLKDKIKAMSGKSMRQENVLLNIDDVETLESLEKANLMSKSEFKESLTSHKKKRLICFRCHKLKHQSHVEESIQARVTCKRFIV